MTVTIRDDIAAIPQDDHRLLGHYMIYCLGISDLPRDGLGNYTAESVNKVRQYFLDVAKLWNETHTEQIEPLFLWEITKTMRDRDLQEYERNRIISR